MNYFNTRVKYLVGFSILIWMISCWWVDKNNIYLDNLNFISYSQNFSWTDLGEWELQKPDFDNICETLLINFPYKLIPWYCNVIEKNDFYVIYFIAIKLWYEGFDSFSANAYILKNNTYTRLSLDSSIPIWTQEMHDYYDVYIQNYPDTEFPNNQYRKLSEELKILLDTTIITNHEYLKNSYKQLQNQLEWITFL